MSGVAPSAAMQARPKAARHATNLLRFPKATSRRADGDSAREPSARRPTSGVMRKLKTGFTV